MRFPKLSFRAWLAIVFCVIFSAHHVLALFTESINWDEFGVLRRAQTAAQTGYLQPGGRPGLGVLILMPFVDGCEDAMANSRLCRVVWLIFSLGYPAALFVLLRRFLSDVRGTTRGAGWDAFTAVPLLVLVPLWLRWSLQIRTDQPASFWVLWAGYFMLRSESSLKWAAAAGFLSALGYLFSQKAAYTGLIVANLVVVHAITRTRPWSWRHWLQRCAWFLVPAVSAIVAFQLVVRASFDMPPAFDLNQGLSHLETHGSALDYKLYPYVLPDMIPHGLLMAGLLVASLPPFLRNVGHRAEIIAAWVTLLCGVAVACFHSSSFGYFWMTIGLFPATALALSMGSIRSLVARLPARPWAFHALYGLGGAWLVYQCIPTATSLLEDSQKGQREALAFVDANFGPHEIGYQAEGALYCREPSSPFGVTFSIHVFQDYYGPDHEQNVAAFIDKLRRTPVSFILQTHRVYMLPEEIRNFMVDNYVEYASRVRVAGKQIPKGGASVEIFVPGIYRWEPAQPSDLHLMGQVLKPGATTNLKPGVHQLRSEVSGILVRAMKGERQRDFKSELFYSFGSTREIAPNPLERGSF